jgi:ribonuclease J
MNPEKSAYNPRTPGAGSSRRPDRRRPLSSTTHRDRATFGTSTAPHTDRPISNNGTRAPLSVRSGARRESAPREGRGAPRRNMGTKSSPRPHSRDIPPLAPGVVRIIPFGGVEEIGKNMTAIEFGNDIVVIDAGFQFREEDTPGVDYILPNTGYLEERKDKIRALVVTHGHLDHIGAIPYIMEKIGNPPIYSRLLTTVMIKKRQEEFPQLPTLDIRVIERGETITLGALRVGFFAVTHTIPDAMGVIVETPYGSIVHTGDLKLDHMDGVVSEKEETEFSIFADKNVLLLMADSTNVEKPGFSIPEATVHKNIEEIIKTTKSRLVIGTFASQLERIIRIIEIAEQFGKKVVVEGRSMKNNIEIVKHLGLLKIKNDTIITSQDMDNFPPDRIVALATGAQGDEFAALMRMANKTNKYFKITKQDTILLSSSIIPGNERAVQKLKDNLSRQGAKIIHYQVADVHSSGHANRDETSWIHKHIRPRFFIPVHGYHYMLRVHADVAAAAGCPEKNIIIPDNGMIIDIVDDGARIIARKERAPSGAVLVDGFSVGDVQEVVLRDRQMLAQDGMFVIIASVNPKTGKLRKSPDIISRGFVYLRESQDLLQQARLIIKKTVEDVAAGMHPINFDYIKSAVSDNVGRFLFQKTNKRPIVIPVLIGV